MMNAEPHHRIRSDSRLEYAFYFALILVISIPTAIVRSMLPNRTGLPRGFVLTEAWAMAHRVTPQIFTA